MLFQEVNASNKPIQSIASCMDLYFWNVYFGVAECEMVDSSVCLVDSLGGFYVWICTADRVLCVHGDSSCRWLTEG